MTNRSNRLKGKLNRQIGLSHTPRGAQASAILYSVIDTAKANGLISFYYVMTCLDELCQPAPYRKRPVISPCFIR
nr:hypothetical protein [Xenorhabdus indica]